MAPLSIVVAPSNPPNPVTPKCRWMLSPGRRHRKSGSTRGARSAGGPYYSRAWAAATAAQVCGLSLPGTASPGLAVLAAGPGRGAAGRSGAKPQRHWPASLLSSFDERADFGGGNSRYASSRAGGWEKLAASATGWPQAGHRLPAAGQGAVDQLTNNHCWRTIFDSETTVGNLSSQFSPLHH